MGWRGWPPTACQGSNFPGMIIQMKSKNVKMGKMGGIGNFGWLDLLAGGKKLTGIDRRN